MAVNSRIAALFYEISADISGFESGTKKAESSAQKLGEMIKKHPMAAMGALAGALVAVGVQATKMAQELEKSFNIIERRVPGAAAHMDKLKATIREMSLGGSGRSQDELAQAAVAISPGVASIEELQQRLQAVTRAADATGESIESIVGGLDQTLDLFGKSSADSEAVLQRIYAVTKGKMPLADMFEAMKGAAPLVREFKLDMDTVTGAVGALLEQGMKPKAAIAEIAKYASAGKEGAAAIEKLAASMQVAGDVSGQYQAAINKSHESTTALWNTTKNNLTAVLVDLGQKVLPIVTTAMKGWVTILDSLNGTANKMDIETLADRVSVLGKNLKTLKATEINELREATGKLAKEFVNGSLALEKMDPSKLAGLQTALKTVLKSEEAGAQRDAYGAMLGAVNKLIIAEGARQDAAKKTTATVVEGADVILARQKVTTDAANAAAKEGAKLHEELMADIAKGTEELARQAAESMWKVWKPIIDAMILVDKQIEDLQTRGIISLSTTEIAAAIPGGYANTPPIVGRASMSQAERDALDAAESFRVAMETTIDIVAGSIGAAGGDLESSLQNLASALSAGIDKLITDVAQSIGGVTGVLFATAASIVKNIGPDWEAKAQEAANKIMAVRDAERALEIAREGGSEATRRRREREDELAAALSETEAALIRERHAIEDVNRATEERIEYLNDERDALIRLAEATGNDALADAQRTGRAIADAILRGGVTGILDLLAIFAEDAARRIQAEIDRMNEEITNVARLFPTNDPHSRDASHFNHTTNNPRAGGIWDRLGPGSAPDDTGTTQDAGTPDSAGADDSRARTDVMMGGRISLVGEDRIVALLTTGNAQRAAVREYLRMLATPMAPISAPVMSGTFGSSAGITVRNTFNNYFGGATPDVRRVATTVSEQMVREIMRIMQRLDRQQRLYDGGGPS